MAYYHSLSLFSCCVIVNFALVWVAAFTPMKILPDKIVSSSCGQYFTLILSKSGVVYGFGQSSNGKLVFGNGNVKLPQAISVPDNKKIVQLSSGTDNSFLVAEDGTVFVFGNQNMGKLGTGAATGYKTSVTSIAIPHNKKIVYSSAGISHSFLLADDGTVFAFGNCINGKLGNGVSSGSVLTPTAISIPGNKTIVHVSAASTHSVLLADDGTVFTMGLATNGLLCNGATAGTVTVPTAISIPNNKKIVKVYTGYSSTLLIAEDGTFFTCGSASGGQLGNGQTSGSSSLPQEIASYNIVEGFLSKVSAYSSVVSEDGSLYMMGSGISGRLGTGVSSTTISVPTKVKIPGRKKIVQVSSGQDHTISVSEDGAVFAMGSVQGGRLGNDVDSGTEHQLTPLEIVEGLDICNCNGHGTCEQGSTQCDCTGNFNSSLNCESCLEGYGGENCTEIICDGISNVNVSAVCGGHGQCVEPDTCKCDAGWDIDPFCNIATCFKHRSDSDEVCSGKGKCVSVNYCRCSQGYGGYKCQRQCTYCYKNSRF